MGKLEPIGGAFGSLLVVELEPIGEAFGPLLFVELESIGSGKSGNPKSDRFASISSII